MTRGEAQIARNKAKRKAAFQLAEARKAPEDRILARSDLDTLVRQTASANKLRQMKQTVQWFIEFWTEGLVESLGTEAEARSFFVAKGPAMPLKTIRQYFLWIATSRQGLIESTLSINTIKIYMLRFFATVEWYQIRDVESEVKQQVGWWIETTLADEAKLHRQVKPKPTARLADVSMLLRTLYTDISLCSFGTMRGVLYLNLFLNLLIDGCGRIGEIVRGSKAPEEQCLKWGDIEIWAKRVPESNVQIYGIVNFVWLKGKRLIPKEYKKVCLNLLGTQFVFEDSLRLLLYIALIEGHFEDVRTWEDLESLNASEYGSLVRIKDSSKDLPVLRSIDHCGRLKDQSISDQTMTKQTGRLGRMTGFREPFTT
jgi:hypothetical protein